MPMRTGTAMPEARIRASQVRIGAASKQNCVTTRASSPFRRANSSLVAQRLFNGVLCDLGVALGVPSERGQADTMLLQADRSLSRSRLALNGPFGVSMSPAITSTRSTSASPRARLR